MQEITLSQYCAEIERLLQDEAYDEAIAHGLHILKRYPKYYRVYRLLGQAYLEKGQDDAAMDLFARALSADPEDFLPRIGLSVIYERKGMIAEATWQMERAFEILPYNEFVREELAKLYARRDGAPPAFLPLTRGALARLYVRGHLYTAAIAELESLLQEAPQRYDLQALYLEALWRDGRRMEAARVAQGLLQELPHCLKANLILGEFWMAGGREADARELFRRAAAVDPELSIVPDLLGPTASVQPAPVSIERLVYMPPVPAYAQPPVEEGEVPEWLQALGLPPGESIPTYKAEEAPEVPVPEAPAAPPATPSEAIEWLGAAAVSPLEETAPPVAEAEGVEMAAGPEMPEAPIFPEEEVPEWLREDFLLPAEWETAETPAPVEEVAAAPALPPEPEAEEAVQLPEWLLALKPSEEEAVPAATEEEQRFRELLEEAAAQPLEVPPEWAEVLGLTPTVPEGEARTVPVPEAPAEVPFWDLLAVDEGVGPAGKVPEPAPAVDPRWLEGLYAVPVAETMAGPLLGILLEYEERLKAQPRDHETRLAMARLLFNLGDTARAAREYQRLLRVSAMRPVVLADLEQAVQLRPHEARLWQVLGDAYQEAGLLQKALEAYRRALATLGS